MKRPVCLSYFGFFMVVAFASTTGYIVRAVADHTGLL